MFASLSPPNERAKAERTREHWRAILIQTERNKILPRKLCEFHTRTRTYFVSSYALRIMSPQFKTMRFFGRSLPCKIELFYENLALTWLLKSKLITSANVSNLDIFLSKDEHFYWKKGWDFDREFQKEIIKIAIVITHQIVHFEFNFVSITLIFGCIIPKAQSF